MIALPLISSCFSGRAMAVAVEPSMEVTTKKPVTKERRVVVTGMGVVTSLGHDPEVFYSNLLEGASGISEIEAFDCATFPTVNQFICALTACCKLWWFNLFTLVSIMHAENCW